MVVKNKRERGNDVVGMKKSNKGGKDHCPVFVRREFQLLLGIEQLDEHLLTPPIQHVKQPSEVRGVNVNKGNHLNCECLQWT